VAAAVRQDAARLVRQVLRRIYYFRLQSYLVIHMLAILYL
jgi:hypothetical protein